MLRPPRQRPAMFNFRETVLTLSMIGFVSGLSWALYRLSDSLGFWPFMAFGAVTLPLMIMGGFAWDHFEKHRNSRESRR
jgi:hypothetical protein